jgi:hypothetical protein
VRTGARERGALLKNWASSSPYRALKIQPEELSRFAVSTGRFKLRFGADCTV